MKVLVTGMASSHTQPSENISFFGTLVKVIETFATVEWATPSVAWEKDFLDQYDVVLVGVVPPTSLGANKVYGAMHVINIMYESPKLRLVVDHPQIWQFNSSLSSVDKDVSSLFSSFYSKRREYKAALLPECQESIKLAARKLLNSPWPVTIYPDMPWKSLESVAQFIAKQSPFKLYGVNLDSHLLTKPVVSSNYSDTWVADAPNSTWTKKLGKLLGLQIHPLKTHLRENEEVASGRLSSSFGLLAAPHDRGVGTWWSYRYIQAMNSLVPVVSDWRETRMLSNSWNVLGSSIEEATPDQRLTIALQQRNDYIDAIPSKEESIEIVKSILISKN